MRHVQRLLTAGALAVLVATAMLATAEVTSRPARGEMLAGGPGVVWVAGNQKGPIGAGAGVNARPG